MTDVEQEAPPTGATTIRIRLRQTGEPRIPPIVTTQGEGIYLRQHGQPLPPGDWRLVDPATAARRAAAVMSEGARWAYSVISRAQPRADEGPSPTELATILRGIDGLIALTSYAPPRLTEADLDPESLQKFREAYGSDLVFEPKVTTHVVSITRNSPVEIVIVVVAILNFAGVVSSRVRAVVENYDAARRDYALTTQEINVGNSKAEAEAAGYQVLAEVFRQNLGALQEGKSAADLASINTGEVVAALSAIERVSVDHAPPALPKA